MVPRQGSNLTAYPPGEVARHVVAPKPFEFYYCESKSDNDKRKQESSHEARLFVIDTLRAYSHASDFSPRREEKRHVR